MSPFYACNAVVAAVERRGGNDRYGRPLYETVATQLSVNLNLTNRMIRTNDGDLVSIDATIFCEQKLVAGDQITLADEFQSKYLVFLVEEAQDVLGNTQYWIYNLRKQRGEDDAS